MSRDEYKKRMKEGMKIDKMAVRKSIEATETFIKAHDPVGMESDKVSKTRYTARIATLEEML